ncbi:hypothetical protein QYF36_012171 [Acer negundo]|nr:hypothetical protein QYF36_012171 [Acer negundo]
MKAPANRRNQYKYCDFHEDVGHNTSECYSLCNQIESLVRGGLLVEFLQQIANCRVHHVLIDTGSSVDILFKGAPEQLNLKKSCYNSCTSPFEPGQVSQEQDHCNLEEGEVPDVMIEEVEVEDQGWTGGYPTEQLEEIPFSKEDPTKVVKIGGALDQEVRRSLIGLIEEYSDIFAWSHDEMPGIPLNLATQRLEVDATFKQVKQKMRHFNAERNAAVHEEVDKLIKARFIKDSRYPEWIANMVMVTKANGKWRMCMDYTDLNRACPKDSFPLPKIDQLIDSTVGNKLLSFMDAFSGYNQIIMHPVDQDKTSFIIA